MAVKEFTRCEKPTNPRFKDLTGQRFGRLVVLRYIGYVIDGKGYRKSLWECECDCETIDIYRTSSLTRNKGGTNSCGCLVRESCIARSTNCAWNRQPPGVAQLSAKWRYLNQGAKVRGLLVFFLKEAHDQLCLSNCYWCGKNPQLPHGNGHIPKDLVIPVNGVDRRDNSLGYVEGNVVSCCATCNEMKMDRAEEEFLAHCRRVVDHQATKVAPYDVMEAALASTGII